MAYDINFPADDSYLSDFPAGDREQNRALKDDQIVNAGRLRGLTVGNENGQIPINNGTENTNLNAALLNGKASSYFATSNHTHTTATQSSNGYISNADKKKLDGIASGAEVNQNAFANVKVGSTTIQSDAKQDTLELAAGTNISLVGDANNDKVTIAVTGKVASATTANKVNNTATNGSAIDLVAGTMASSDNFRIRIGGSNDAGYAEIATADNGNEPIYIRQYGPGFTTATRTATILDGSGNTSFPGTVTAPNFNGKATKATQDSDGNTITSTYLKRNPSAQNDMNACTVQGIYRFDGQLKNAWTSTSWGTLLVFNNNYNGGSGTTGTYLVQMAFPTDGRIWTRQRVNTGAWESWYCTAYTYSPAFSGSPTAPTPATTDNSTRVATTAYVKNNISETLKKVYPVGSIYMSTVSTNPATLFGFGTWEAMPAGRVLLAQGKSSWGTTYNAGSTGGEATHQLTVG
ncbi:MAG: phage baseplate protein, partial [Megamonas funiformis]